MRKTLARTLLLAAILVIAAFLVFLVNQTAQLVALAEALHPVAGDVALWSLVALYGFCVAVPVLMLVRLPSALVPPEPGDAAAERRHLERLARRLNRSGNIDGTVEATPASVEAALAQLDARADAAIKAAGGQVFLATAVSQNGSLDGVVVLAAQSKLVLDVARIYWQRPRLRELGYLYANVAATAFIAAQIEDIDLAEQIQPVLTSVLGSAVGAVPGFQAASVLIVGSVMTGSANAFLTLRVGAVTKRYCRALARPERSALRRAAVADATRLLGVVALENAGRVTTAVWEASRRRVGGAFSGMGTSVRQATQAAGERLGLRKSAAGTEPAE